MALHNSLRYVVLVLLWSSVLPSIAKLPPPTLTQVLGPNSGLCTSGRHHCNPQTCLNRLNAVWRYSRGDTNKHLLPPERAPTTNQIETTTNVQLSTQFYRGFLNRSMGWKELLIEMTQRQPYYQDKSWQKLGTRCSLPSQQACHRWACLRELLQLRGFSLFQAALLFWVAEESQLLIHTQGGGSLVLSGQFQGLPEPKRASPLEGMF